MKKMILMSMVVMFLFAVNVQAQFTAATIADIQNGVYTEGTNVEITGIVISPGLDENHIYVQDAQAQRSGIRCYGGNNYDIFDSVNVGDNVTVQAVYSEYYGESELDFSTTGSFTVNSTGNTVWDPIVVTGSVFDYDTEEDTEPAENYESVLVTVYNVTITDDTSPGNSMVDGTDDGGTTTLRFEDEYIDPTEVLTVGNTYNITGVAMYTWYDYKISPRSAADIIDLSEAPKVTSAEFGAPDKILVIFSQGIGEATAETASNYVVNPGSLTPASVELQADASSVILTMSSDLSEGTTYTVTVSNVDNLAGVVVDPANNSGSCSHSLPDVVINEVMYDSISGGQGEMWNGLSFIIQPEAPLMYPVGL